MQCIYTYIPDTNCVLMQYSVAAILLLLFMVLILLVSVLNIIIIVVVVVAVWSLRRLSGNKDLN